MSHLSTQIHNFLIINIYPIHTIHTHLMKHLSKSNNYTDNRMFPLCKQLYIFHHQIENNVLCILCSQTPMDLNILYTLNHTIHINQSKHLKIDSFRKNVNIYLNRIYNPLDIISIFFLLVRNR